MLQDTGLVGSANAPRLSSDGSTVNTPSRPTTHLGKSDDDNEKLIERVVGGESRNPSPTRGSSEGGAKAEKDGENGAGVELSTVVVPATPTGAAGAVDFPDRGLRAWLVVFGVRRGRSASYL